MAMRIFFSSESAPLAYDKGTGSVQHGDVIVCRVRTKTEARIHYNSAQIRVINAMQEHLRQRVILWLRTAVVTRYKQYAVLPVKRTITSSTNTWDRSMKPANVVYRRILRLWMPNLTTKHVIEGSDESLLASMHTLTDIVVPPYILCTRNTTPSGHIHLNFNVISAIRAYSDIIKGGFLATGGSCLFIHLAGSSGAEPGPPMTKAVTGLGEERLQFRRRESVSPQSSDSDPFVASLTMTDVALSSTGTCFVSSA
ncbi:predicted protein [Pyrenophora tritici-repentis Pt-1C-BFP]|uniref:Uncharacterized protein n=1 Tax=Pyrenophora tritici-repentis (strain Pt-1C-BFP) TaxID=426418 RepID=B2WFD6_PYRTR|nr:uncharacterized protein PTRG_09204 [Pyrenophora tritici-repentis Pt-1C-BFP]EDU42255.1 predicted protein [Pyrenophora tritici-repentis Pt-1C-BFP]